jgi:hypothetical protein
LYNDVNSSNTSLAAFPMKIEKRNMNTIIEEEYHDDNNDANEKMHVDNPINEEDYSENGDYHSSSSFSSNEKSLKGRKKETPEEKKIRKSTVSHN